MQHLADEKQQKYSLCPLVLLLCITVTFILAFRPHLLFKDVFDSEA